MGYTSNVSSGLVSNKSVNNGDTLNVYSNGVGSNTSVSVGGTLNVYNQGVIRKTTIDKNGTVKVTSNGSAYDTNIKAGYLIVANGSNNYVENTTATYAEISVTDGKIVNTILNEGGSLYVSEKGIASNVTINNAKDLGVIVSNYGQMYSATINSGGTMDVSSFGYAYDTTISSGGTLNVSSSGYAYDTTISIGGSMNVYSAGYAQDTTVRAKAFLNVNGGIISNTTTLGYSYLTITSNGSAYNNTVAGTIFISNGANNYLENTVASNATISITDGKMVSTTLNDNGTIFVTDNGIVSNTIINNIADLGVGVSNNGKAYSTTINSGGTMDISSSGYAYDTTISSGGTLNIYSDGYAEGTTVYFKGSLNVAGGVISNTNTKNYITLTITSNGSAYDNNFNGGTILISNGTNNYLENTVANDATISISDGKMVSTTLNNYGTIFVTDNGIVSNTTINNTKDIGIGISNNGKAFSTTINSGGTMSVSADGYAYDTTINGGNLYVFDTGAVVSNTNIQNNGILHVYSQGQSYDTIVNDGGLLSVYSNGITHDVTVNTGGVLRIDSGGNLDGTVVIDNGGSAVLWYGAGGSANLLGHDHAQIIITGLNGSSNFNSNINITTVFDSFTGQDPGNSDAIVLAGINQADVINVAYEDAEGNANPDYVTLTLKDGSKITMNIVGAEQSGYHLSSQDGNLVYEVCFLTGSMIRTTNGDVNVEDLHIGDQIVTYDWQNNREIIQNVIWLGYKNAIVNPTLPDDQAGYPLRILKDAIAENVPYKDLLITPEHCLFFDGKLIPARMLVNNYNIFYDYSITDYTYYHVETDTHSVIWADGMLTESYLDTGNRQTFHKDENNVILFSQKTTEKNWEKDSSASLVTDRNTVEPLFNKLVIRAKQLGFSKRTNELVLDNDPQLFVTTKNGQTIYPHAKNNDRFLFAIPSDVDNIQLVSKSNRPSDTIGAFVDDRRELGVLIGNITLLSQKSMKIINTHLCQKNLDGWHDIESHLYRWTNGNAELPIDLLEINNSEEVHYNILIVHVVAGGPYISYTQKIKKIA